MRVQSTNSVYIITQLDKYKCTFPEQSQINVCFHLGLFDFRVRSVHVLQCSFRVITCSFRTGFWGITVQFFEKMQIFPGSCCDCCSCVITYVLEVNWEPHRCSGVYYAGFSTHFPQRHEFSIYDPIVRCKPPPKSSHNPVEARCVISALMKLWNNSSKLRIDHSFSGRPFSRKILRYRITRRALSGRNMLKLLK